MRYFFKDCGSYIATLATEQAAYLQQDGWTECTKEEFDTYEQEEIKRTQNYTK